MADYLDVLTQGLAATGALLLVMTGVRHWLQVRRKAALLREQARREEAAYYSLDSVMRDLSAVVEEAAQRADDKLLALERVLKHAAQREEELRCALDAGAQVLKVLPREKGDWRPQAAELAGAGHDAREIARRLGLAVGEVELWLALRPGSATA